MRIIIFLFFILVVDLSAQELDAHLKVFSPLIGKTWVAEGTWGNGTVFKQEIKFNVDLGGKMIEAVSQGFTDEGQTTWGKRNHGIRKWDLEEKTIKFWEFDVFGGLTEGTVTPKGKDLYHQYSYGGTLITDAWIWKDEKTYILKIGSYVNNNWEQIYLQTEFRALPHFTGPREDLDALLEGMDSFSKTYIRGDHEAIAGFYTTEGKIMPNGPGIIKGREAIAERWKLAEGTKVLHHKIIPEEVHILEAIAYDYGYYEGKTQSMDKEPVEFKGKYVIIWKKINDQWLIDIDIWNRVNN